MFEKYDIFISYSKADFIIANKISSELQYHGFKTWIDFSEFTSQSMMLNSLKNSKLFLFISSINSNASCLVEKQVCAAIEHNKPIITIKLDNSAFNPSFIHALGSFDSYLYHGDAFMKRLPSIIEHKIKEDYSWVFISHSTKDFEYVRLVRNALEKKGHRPILFYLRCLSNKEEVYNLLRREIDARHRFILCRSDNALTSSFVQYEVEYIQSKNRMYETIDLSKINLGSPNIEQEVLELIKPFERRVSVFLDNTINDEIVASELKKRLNLMGLNVFSSDFFHDKIPGTANQQDWEFIIKQSIKATLDKGYFIALIGDKTPKFFIEKIEFAYQIAPSRVLPVIISTLSEKLISDIIDTNNILNISHLKSIKDKVNVIAESLITLDLENQDKS